MSRRVETWSRGVNGIKQSVTFYVDESPEPDPRVEPSGTVVVSIEILSRMLADLGYFRERYPDGSLY